MVHHIFAESLVQRPVPAACGAPRGVYLKDPVTKREFTHGESGGMTTASRPDGHEELVYVDVPPPEPMTPAPFTEKEQIEYDLMHNPQEFLGKRLCKNFTEDGINHGDYEGTVTHTYPTENGQYWLIEYDDDDETDEFDTDDVRNYVVNRHIMPVDTPKPKQRVFATADPSEGVLGAGVDTSSLGDDAVDPYAPLHVTSKKPLRLDVRREDVHWLREQVSKTSGIYVTERNENYTAVCDRLGLPVHHRMVYYNWLGHDFGPRARRQDAGYLGFKFLSPWEGERRKAKFPTGSEFPIPGGPSWKQWLLQHQREESEAKAKLVWQHTTNAQEHKLVQDAIGAVHAKVFRAHVARLNTVCRPFMHLHDGHQGEPDTELWQDQYENSTAYSVTARSFAKAIGVPESDKRVQALIDPNTGKITHPSKLSECKGRIDEKFWTAAFQCEKDAIISHETLNPPESIESVRKSGIRARPVKMRMLFEIKSDSVTGDVSKWKCRAVVLGHAGSMRKGEHFNSTFAAAPNPEVERLLQALCVQLGWTRRCGDLETAYLWGDMPEEEQIPVIPFDGYLSSEDEGKVCVLRGNCYGCPQAAAVYQACRDNFLLNEFNNLKLGWICKQAEYDPCLFIFKHYKGGVPKHLLNSATRRIANISELWELIPQTDHTIDQRAHKEARRTPLPIDPKLRKAIVKETGGAATATTVFLSVHSDDCSCIAEDGKDLDYIFSRLHKRFRIKPGNPADMLGLARTISPDGTKVKISMKPFINDLVEAFADHLPTRKPTTPFPPRLHLEAPGPDDEYDPVLGAKIKERGYLSAVGSLLWVSRMVAPHLSSGVSMLCRRMQSPSDEAWGAAMQAIAYLRDNPNTGITFRRDYDKPAVTAFADASFKNDHNDGTGLGGYIIYLFGGPIVWSTFKCPDACTSAYHAEYMALSNASRTVSWLRYLLIEMGLGEYCKEPSLVYGDNDAASDFARKNQVTPRNRYYEHHTHFAKEAFDRSRTMPIRVDTKENLSDLTTKIGTAEEFRRFTAGMTGEDSLSENFKTGPPGHRPAPNPVPGMEVYKLWLKMLAPLTPTNTTVGGCAAAAARTTAFPTATATT